MKATCLDAICIEEEVTRATTVTINLHKTTAILSKRDMPTTKTDRQQHDYMVGQCIETAIPNHPGVSY